MKPIILTHKTWDLIQQRIREEYPPSISLISWKAKIILGFTVREHRAWIPNKNYDREMMEYALESKKNHWLLIEPSKGSTETRIHLDFYSEKKRTMFLMKYSEYIRSEQ